MDIQGVRYFTPQIKILEGPVEASQIKPSLWKNKSGSSTDHTRLVEQGEDNIES